MRLFGTNGIREVVGERMTAPFVTSIAAAIGRTYPVGAPLAVGWDGRTSSPAFARLVSGTLAAAGHSVVELGLLPTPAIQYNMRSVGAQLGVIVTASHNPPEFNGIKCIGADGLELPRTDEERIEAAVEAGEVRSVPHDRVGEIRSDDRGAERYLHGILATVNRDAIIQKRFRVLLDCGNGASAQTSPSLLRRLGCRFTTLNGQVDGTFPGHLSEPTEQNLQELIRTVPAVGVDFGVAHDGDADRAVFVDAHGHYVPGERMLTWFAREYVRQHRGGLVVIPVTASQSVEEVVRAEGGQVLYTRVGSPSITHAMQERGAVFGGEDNGGYVFPQFQLARDGAMTLAAALDLLTRLGTTLEEALRDLPYYHVSKEKVPCPPALQGEVMDLLAAELAQGADRVVTLDGIKAYQGSGWVLVRPSGTEPLFRIFSEDRDPEVARRRAAGLVARVSTIVAELEGPAGRS
ncbi:MAG: phosphoglucosamine mutase [Thermoplasmata archaeon]|nr:phosphoglucosamine mutase [Thermoplasmata archaeon]